eukprot:TRINITY_DN732_c0_g1_i1.p1 TRINITY_DN732_c0_g1~~TRINITY_DN732_c0_g1_i1.p1  ORF type:complete len:526 (+),score=192.17 TRINITY_DN732_c0_g1_i1:255-1832(+)
MDSVASSSFSDKENHTLLAGKKHLEEDGNPTYFGAASSRSASEAGNSLTLEKLALQETKLEKQTKLLAKNAELLKTHESQLKLLTVENQLLALKLKTVKEALDRANKRRADTLNFVEIQADVHQQQYQILNRELQVTYKLLETFTVKGRAKVKETLFADKAHVSLTHALLKQTQFSKQMQALIYADQESLEDTDLERPENEDESEIDRVDKKTRVVPPLSLGLALSSTEDREHSQILAESAADRSDSSSSGRSNSDRDTEGATRERKKKINTPSKSSSTKLSSPRKERMISPRRMLDSLRPGSKKAKKKKVQEVSIVPPPPIFAEDEEGESPFLRSHLDEAESHSTDDEGNAPRERKRKHRNRRKGSDHVGAPVTPDARLGKNSRRSKKKKSLIDEREKERSSDKEKEGLKDKDLEKEKDRLDRGDKEKDSEKERTSDKEKEKEKERIREKAKEKDSEGEKDEKETEKEQEKDKSKERDRDRDSSNSTPSHSHHRAPSRGDSPGPSHSHRREPREKSLKTQASAL